MIIIRDAQNFAEEVLKDVDKKMERFKIDIRNEYDPFVGDFDSRNPPLIKRKDMNYYESIYLRKIIAVCQLRLHGNLLSNEADRKKKREVV